MPAPLLEIPDAVSRQLARAWLWLGVASLIGSGLLAILLVLSRTPGIQDAFPLLDFFRAALVVHVDLSVLVWFMAFAAVLWSMTGSGQAAALGRGGFLLAAIGTALITISPFAPDSHPLLNNYIPMLRHPLFVAGLLIAGSGFGLAIVRALLTIPVGAQTSTQATLRLGSFLAALAGAIALAAFVTSWATGPDYEGQAYYEAIYWGGGHALQFQHTLLLLVAWLWLGLQLGAKLPVSSQTVATLLVVAALPLVAVPLIYAFWPVGTPLHIVKFVSLMQWGHLAMFPLILLAAAAIWQSRGKAEPARSALLASFSLFAVGGILAFMIQGVNVVIPAHYHGSIVGVTLAFMGLTYVVLPQLGFRPVAGRLARWQPYIYGGGQLLHILGLAWSGGYGVQRKVAGAEQALTTLPQKIGMGMMGLGGLIAIIGGLIFVLICLKSMTPSRSSE
ncbi:MAG: cbb3-type cytochrome c oxidase subunit I [Rhodocyclales bacterium]|nr:cbb3-type cytochrome c oxidase subunit I [Rhodocyclales bacterium]